MKKILLRWLINAIAVWVAVRVVPGLSAEGGWTVIAAVALILGLANALLRPLLVLLTCPLLLLTLGLFSLVINAAVLLVASWVAELLALPFHVAGFWPAFWGGLIISIVSVILSIFFADEKKEKHH